MELNRSNIKKLLLLITFAIAVYLGLNNIVSVKGYIMKGLWLLFPFILGGCMAFIVNVPMRAIENFLFASSTNVVLNRLKRPISLLIAIVLIGFILFGITFLIVPEIVRTIDIISASLPTFAREVQLLASTLLAQYPEMVEVVMNFAADWSDLTKKVFDFIQNSAGNFLSSTVGVATSIVGAVINSFLGLIFALYVLLQKEKLSRQSKQLMYAFFPEKVGEKMIYIGRLVNQTFSKFLSGQCLEACILGAMFFVAMTLFKFPYPLLIGVLIGFTSLVPVFGAFIGCFVGAFLILISSPIKALWFILLFLILQQIEGNLIYPHVVGGSVGLPSIWVLVAVTLGGSLMGIVGMIIFIPLCSVIYTLLRENVYYRLEERQISPNKWR